MYAFSGGSDDPLLPLFSFICLPIGAKLLSLFYLFLEFLWRFRAGSVGTFSFPASLHFSSYVSPPRPTICSKAFSCTFSKIALPPACRGAQYGCTYSGYSRYAYPCNGSFLWFAMGPRMPFSLPFYIGCWASGMCSRVHLHPVLWIRNNFFSWFGSGFSLHFESGLRMKNIFELQMIELRKKANFLKFIPLRALYLLFGNRTLLGPRLESWFEIYFGSYPNLQQFRIRIHNTAYIFFRFPFFIRSFGPFIICSYCGSLFRICVTLHFLCWIACPTFLPIRPDCPLFAVTLLYPCLPQSLSKY